MQLAGYDQVEAESEQVEAGHSRDTEATFQIRFEAPRSEARSGQAYRTGPGLSVVLLSIHNAAKFLVVPDPCNVDMFCAMMKRHPPTVLANVPPPYMTLIDSPRFREVDFSRLRVAVSGAAPFPVEAIRKLEAIVGEKKLCEGYGMTEASPFLTCNPPQRSKTGSIGEPGEIIAFRMRW